ncbi:MAG TPA: MFS transporter, partial [Candidatus Limnocylindria bacterium]|nr:MFS transporter [Candidatus Limnocylindria bacterium]
SFGAIYGQQRDWKDPVAYIALGAGVVATFAFPFLMARARDPLVPLELFRSRNFTVTNISTFLIYGALYVTFYYLALFLQGVLGYSAAAAGLAGIPGGLLLVVLSTRFGALSARYGPKAFMTIGPALMAIGVVWFARVPATSPAWVFIPGDPSTWVAPSAYFVDFLPGQIIFGFGLAMMVAPLTTALMTSVPVRNSGVASAINNAISRVGPQLAGAVIFVAITASFYAGMAARLPGTDTSDPTFRHDYSPMNVPRISDQRAQAAGEQSTDAFHLAMLVGAGLLAAGAIVNFVGISNEVALAKARQEPAPAT